MSKQSPYGGGNVKKVVPVVLALAITGCATTNIQNPGLFEPVQLEPSEVMPSKEELAGKPARVVVFNADDGDINLAKTARLGATISGEIEKYLSKADVELVDRSLAAKLQEELMLAEMHGRTDYTGPAVADIAIVSAITQASVSSSFTEAKRWQDKKGKWHSTSAKCSYSSDVAGTIRVYKMPSMQPIALVDLEGKTSTSEETRYSQCPVNQAGAEGLARTAATNGVAAARAKLKNNFAPRGYITEHRFIKNKHIIKINIGSKRGLKTGDRVQVMTVSRSFDPLSNKESIETTPLGTGRVTNQIGNNFAWIIVDKKIADQIRLGQPVQATFSIPIWETMARRIN